MLGLSDSEWRLVADILIKLGIGALLAGLIGWEREIHARPAGVRTHMLLVIGVILFSEVSRKFGGDEGRIAAQVVTGVGFLGAGTIIRTGTDVKGLTTAASLWATSAIGMALSLGGPFIAIAVASVGLSLITLIWVDRLEEKFLKKHILRTLRVSLTSREGVADVLEIISKDEHIQLHQTQLISAGESMELEFKLHGSANELVELLLKHPSVRTVGWH